MDNEYKDFIDELSKFQNETNYNQEDRNNNLVDFQQSEAAAFAARMSCLRKNPGVSLIVVKVHPSLEDLILKTPSITMNIG